jgi:hypothetical protein
MRKGKAAIKAAEMRPEPGCANRRHQTNVTGMDMTPARNAGKRIAAGLLPKYQTLSRTNRECKTWLLGKG